MGFRNGKTAAPATEKEQAMTMAETTETTRIVKVTDILHEQPPVILTSEIITGQGGRPRLFTQKIHVLEADLWRHLVTEIQRGDTVQVTVKTVWPDEGHYYTYLGEYTRLEVPIKTVELAGAAG